MLIRSNLDIVKQCSRTDLANEWMTGDPIGSGRVSSVESMMDECRADVADLVSIEHA